MKQLSFYRVNMDTGNPELVGTATLTDSGDVVVEPDHLNEVTSGVPFAAGGVELTPDDGEPYLGALYNHFGNPAYFWAEPSADSEEIEKFPAEPWYEDEPELGETETLPHRTQYTDPVNDPGTSV